MDQPKYYFNYLLNTLAIIIKNKKNGFTLPETLVYIAILVIIASAISIFAIWSIKASGKIKVENETMQSASQAMDILIYEIKEAKSVYLPTSVFDQNFGQLSLETTLEPPAYENTTYIDFYICGGQICLKRENQAPIAITSDKTTVTDLTFSRIMASTTETVKINLSLKYNTPNNRPEWQATTTLTTTAAVKGF